MKKLIAMLLALTMMAVMFVGCSEETVETKPTETPVVTDPIETEEATEEVAGDVTENVDPSEELGEVEIEMTELQKTVNAIIEKNPVEFMGGMIPVDLTDTSEDGLWAIKSFTGLDSAEKLNEVAVYEPMMGSMAFSMVLVRVNDAAEAQAVGQQMSDNIDTRKWVCVEANEKIVVGSGDVVMLIMLNSELGLTAQSFVDAFVEIVGQADFTI